MIRATAIICAITLVLATRLPAQDSPTTDPVEAVRQSGLALMRSNAAALNDPAMGQLIQQPTATTSPAAGLVVMVQREAPAAIVAPLPASKAELVPAAQPATSAATVPQTQPSPEASADDLAAAALQKAKSAEPLALADELYSTGHHKAAAIFYEQATTQAKAQGDKEWALFQLANCKSHVDQAAAMALYKQFLQQYPKSSWSEAATARLQLLSWRQSQTQAPSTKGAAK